MAMHRRPTRLRVGRLAFSVGLGFWCVATFAQGDPGGRPIPFQPGVSIESQLRPDDTLVTVVRYVDVVSLEPSPTVRQQLTYNVALSDFVAVVEVRSTVGELTPDRSWIVTRIAGRVQRMLTPAKDLTMPGKDIDVEEVGGGEQLINGHRVRAGMPVELPRGQQYLMFVRSNSDTHRLELATSPYSITRGRLKRVPIEGALRQPDPLETTTLENVAREIGRIPRRP